MDSDVQARSLHKDFAFTSVVWLVCSRSSEVTAQLRSFSGHKNCLFGGKFPLGISVVASKVTMLILLCFSCKGQEQASLGLQPGTVLAAQAAPHPGQAEHLPPCLLFSVASVLPTQC